METISPQTRQTKYCTQIERIIAEFGHASNAEILAELHQTFPDVSATTVHRATARLASRGEISLAPADPTGAMRYDSNTTPHDHFMCTHCGLLRDVDIADKVRPLLMAEIDGCDISSRITVSGTCKTCTTQKDIA